MTIKEWQEKINKWAEQKGWNERLNATPDCLGKQITNMHSELSEAWEEIKDGHGIRDVYYSHGSGQTVHEKPQKPEGFGIELADCVIRIMHTLEYYSLDLEDLMTIKQSYNETRAYRHGGKTA
jgi:hypothetical protein